MTETAERVIYLRFKKYGGITTINLIGETTRSWVSGTTWHPKKWAKKDYEVVTKEAYYEWSWAMNNRYRIGEMVRSCTNPAILHKIAELVGYSEKPQA